MRDKPCFRSKRLDNMALDVCLLEECYFFFVVGHVLRNLMTSICFHERSLLHTLFRPYRA